MGVCHLVIARIAPEARIVDLAHGIRGVRAGSALVAQSVIHAPAGSTHLAVVDPGVGTSRKAVAVRTARGDVLVGPDNGLLVGAAQALGGAAEVVELADLRFRLEPVSATFHGRDIFAPAAAHIAAGVGLTELGPSLDPQDLVAVDVSPCIVSDGCLQADVMRVDWYGNLQLAATSGELDRAGLGERVHLNGVEAVVGRTFADAAKGGLVVYVDSGEHVAVACNGGSARELLQDPERVTLKRKT